MASTNVGSIHYDLGLDKSKFDSASAGVNDSIKNMAKVATVAFAAISTAVIGFGAFSLKSAGDVEMLRASFDTMLGSAEAGAKLFTQLQDMAVVTPFETTDLADASKTLLAFGISANDLLPDLKMLGDVSLGNKEKFNSLALAFGQIRSKGRLMGQEMLQLTNVGFNPLQKISDRTGESMISLTKKMEKGEITFEMVSDEFQLATKKGGQFFNGMEKGATTLPGLFSTLSDTLGITARAMVGLNSAGDIVAGSLLDRFKNGIKNFIPFLNEVGKNAGPILTNALKTMDGILKNIIPKIIDVAKQVGDYLIPKFKGLWESITNNLMPILTDLWHNVIEPLAPVFGTVLVAAIGAVTDTIKILLDWLGSIYQGFKDGNPVIIGLATTFGILATAMAFNAIFNALTVGFATLTLVTIPSVMTSFGMLAGLIASPIVMPAIAIGAALASIAAVWDAYNKMKSAIDGLKTQQQNLISTNEAAYTRYAQIVNNGVSSPAAKANARKQMAAIENMKIPGLANGTNFAPGGMTLVGERGPELVNLPRGSQVIPNNKLGGSLGMTSIYGDVNIGSQADSDYFFTRLNRSSDLMGMGLAG